MYQNTQIWLGAYLKQLARSILAPPARPPRLVLVAVADHYEPFWNRASLETCLERVRAWQEGLPRMCREISDAVGKAPQHTFFYPLEEYHPEVLDRLAGLCAQGLGEVEIHLHHHGETSGELQEKLEGFAGLLHSRHGLLRKDPASGRLTYGFVHGDWALDNSLPDGTCCGVNDELLVLKKSGCYADFTLPSAPSPAQTSTINSIYYATDDPERPKSHDRGRPARVGQGPSGDLLMVQGVLALDWRRRKLGLVPRMEPADLGAHRPLTLDRVPIWLRFAPYVQGAEEVRFVKLSCHGAPERHAKALLGDKARAFYQALAGGRGAPDGVEFRFVSCWEMVKAIHALENGEVLN